MNFVRWYDAKMNETWLQGVQHEVRETMMWVVIAMCDDSWPEDLITHFWYTVPGFFFFHLTQCCDVPVTNSYPCQDWVSCRLRCFFLSCLVWEGVFYNPAWQACILYSKENDHDFLILCSTMKSTGYRHRSPTTPHRARFVSDTFLFWCLPWCQIVSLCWKEPLY